LHKTKLRREGKSIVIETYQFLQVCPQKLEVINLAFAKKYPSLAAAEAKLGLSDKTIGKFLRGDRVRRKTFLNMCKLLGLAPLAIAGLESGFIQKGRSTEVSEIPEPQDLRDADFEQVIEFLSEQQQQGKIVTFTGHNSNICHFTSKELTAERFGAANPQTALKNLDYLECWKKTGSLEHYFKMRQYLEKDGYILGYTYQLVRPSDGALVEYSSDFFLVNELMGQEERICVSNPASYHIVSV
jgi:hypothetical protein